MGTNLEAIRPDGLIEARHNLTAKENNLIDLVLNTIKDDNKYKYEIDIQKYKELYNQGSTNIYRDLKNATDELFEKHNKFYIKDKLTGRERKFVWFSMLEYIPKEGQIIFEVGDTLKNLMLEMKKRIYYKIEYPINFKSLYSKRIYYMLKSFEDTGWRIDKIDELKFKLNCPKSYKNHAVFKIKVLDMAFKEINGSSDINFTYDEIKTGRKVTSLKFYISSNKKTCKNEIAAALVEAPKDQDLIKQLQVIFYKHKITEHEASCILKDAKNNIDLIKQCYNYSLKKDIPNIVGYMRTLVKGFNKPQSNTKTGEFNDYEQREYDFDELEKKLLGWDNNKHDNETDYVQEAINI